MKHLIIMLTLILAATLFHTVPAEAARSDSETISQMFLEVQNSEVLILNEKPLHVDFLSAVLAEHQNTGVFEIVLIISSDAPMGLVRDTKQLLNELGIEANLSIAS